MDELAAYATRPRRTCAEVRLKAKVASLAAASIAPLSARRSIGVLTGLTASLSSGVGRFPLRATTSCPLPRPHPAAASALLFNLLLAAPSSYYRAFRTTSPVPGGGAQPVARAPQAHLTVAVVRYKTLMHEPRLGVTRPGHSFVDVTLPRRTRPASPTGVLKLPRLSACWSDGAHLAAHRLPADAA